MELTDFKALAQAKDSKVRLTLLGADLFQIVTPRFDMTSGEELTPGVTQLNFETVENKRKEIQELLDKLNSQISSLAYLKEQMTNLKIAAQG